MTLISCVVLNLLVSNHIASHTSLSSIFLVTLYVRPVNQDVKSAKATSDQLLPLWKKFLLNQFHDVLPGSCIQQVDNAVVKLIVLVISHEHLLILRRWSKMHSHTTKVAISFLMVCCA